MYQLAFLPEVEGDLKQLDRPIRQRILDKTQWLAEHAVLFHQLASPTCLTNGMAGTRPVYWDVANYSDGLVAVKIVDVLDEEWVGVIVE